MIKTIFTILGAIIKTAWIILKWPLIIAGGVILALILLYVFMLFYQQKIKGLQRIENNGDHIGIKEEKIYIKVFKAIRQMAIDNITRDPTYFVPRQGRIIVFTGRQGQGKTLSMTRHLMRSQEEWPHLKVATNYGYNYENEELNDWRKIIDLENEKKDI